MTLNKLPQMDYAQIGGELATACWLMMDRGQMVFDDSSRRLSAARNRAKTEALLRSKRRGEQLIGIEQYRVAYETWLLDSGEISRRLPADLNLSLTEAWGVFQDWVLLIFGPHSELQTYRAQFPEFEQAFSRLPDDYQEWLRAGTPRQPFSPAQMSVARQALQALRELITYIRDENEQELEEAAMAALTELAGQGRLKGEGVAELLVGASA